MKKKRAFTLLEIMIVILLITLITGAIGYNMRGTLEKGKVFRTEQAKEQLEDLLLICLAEGGDIEQIAANPAANLFSSGLAKNPQKLVLDGWNEAFQIRPNASKTGFIINSAKFDTYREKMRSRDRAASARQPQDPDAEFNNP